MTLTIKPIQAANPAFAGEVSGLDLRQPLSPADAASIHDGMTRYAVLVFHGQDITDEQQLAFSRALGPLEQKVRPGTIRKAAEQPAGRRHGRSLQPRQERQGHLGRRPPVVLQARRPVVALRQLLRRGPGQVLGPVGPHDPVVGRPYRVRRHARGLRRARRSHQSRSRGPDLRALADPLTRRDRLQRVHTRGGRELPSGAPAPGAHPRRRPPVAVPVEPCRRDRRLDDPRGARRSCAT